MEYFILTTKKERGILVTQDLEKCYDFIVKHNDTKIRRMNHSAKPRIFDRRKFLKEFRENIKDINKFFILTDILVKGKSNVFYFLGELNLTQEYKAHKEHFKNIL